MKTINLVLLGAPGAGKGTQAELLVKGYDLLHISTGDMLRETVKSGSYLGQEIEKYMTSGILVPDEIVTQSVLERIAKPDTEKGIILDGYPRTRAQAESLDKALKKKGSFLSLVLYMKTSEKVAVERLSGRRVCPKCKKNYHIKNIPPKVEGVCDTCGIKLIQREDDKAETVKKRLYVYEQQTKDLVEYYREKGVLREVDGDAGAAELFKKIGEIFKTEGLLNDNPIER